MCTVREKPILFSGDMVRALLAGTKTQTRRIVEGSPSLVRWNPISINGKAGWEDEHGRSIRYLYGQPSDRLWVREAWHPDPSADDAAWNEHFLSYFEWSGCGSRIDSVPSALQKPEHCIYRASWDGHELVWRPSIHMPRWASRILLVITGVWAERLQDITFADAQAEGWPSTVDGNPNPYDPITWFKLLWEQLHGAGSWDANPLVWRISFRKVEA